MSNFTERAIIASFIELLNERPLDKITVMDIAARCEINRNTFYYHFHDVYELLDTVLAAEEERIYSLAQENFATWDESLLAATQWARSNQKALEHAYKSVNRERLEEYISRSARTAMGRFIEQQATGLDVPAHVTESLTRIMAAALEGLVLDWLRDGMSFDAADFIADAGVLLNGSTRDALERAAAQQQ